MELKELALSTRAEIEQELDMMCPFPENPKNTYEVDLALKERAEIRKSILRLQVDAFLDGKLTIDQVVALQRTDNEKSDVDDVRRDCLVRALDALKDGRNREDIIYETVNNLNLL
jgi:hypothetical protein